MAGWPTKLKDENMVARPEEVEPASPHLPFAYDLFGLHVHSEMALPELLRGESGNRPDVTIRLGTLPPIEGERIDGFAVTSAGSLLNVIEAGRYLIRNGNEIIVEPRADGSERHLRLYLLGSAFGVLLHQRNLLPLHANSIEIEGRAVAFLGHSGAGKSTMAAWFHDRGSEVLADDVCVVTLDGPRPMAQPGIPRLRMWRDALEASGRSAETHELSFDDAEKYNVPTRRNGSVRPLELGAIYLLKTVDGEARHPFIESLRGVEALDALVANTYRGAYVQMLGGTAAHLAACLTLVKTIPIFVVQRVWGRDHIDVQLQQVEEHARQILRGSATTGSRSILPTEDQQEGG